MKVKDLIKKLNELDPTGETEVCVWNQDIHFVSEEPAYYDGCLQLLTRDPSNEYYNITGAKYISSGSKIVIRPLSIAEAIFNNTDLTVEYDKYSLKYKEGDEKTRKKSKEIYDNIEMQCFIQYVNLKASEITSDQQELISLKKIATNFFEENMSAKDPMPQDIKTATKTEYMNGAEKTINLSWNARRSLQWDRELEIIFDGFDWSIKKK